jgi:hypothetical protein
MGGGDMTTDFGARPRRRAMPVGRIFLAFWIVALLGAAGAKFYLDRQAAIKNARAWSASGPPCPAGPTPQDDGFQPGQRAFSFEKTMYLSDFKGVKCSTMRDQGGLGQGQVAVCKLKGSTYINLTITNHRFRFLTGRNATISIEHGAPACVLDAG